MPVPRRSTEPGQPRHRRDDDLVTQARPEAISTSLRGHGECPTAADYAVPPPPPGCYPLVDAKHHVVEVGRHHVPGGRRPPAGALHRRRVRRPVPGPAGRQAAPRRDGLGGRPRARERRTWPASASRSAATAHLRMRGRRARLRRRGLPGRGRARDGQSVRFCRPPRGGGRPRRRAGRRGALRRPLFTLSIADDTPVDASAAGEAAPSDLIPSVRAPEPNDRGFDRPAPRGGATLFFPCRARSAHGRQAMDSRPTPVEARAGRAP